MTRTKGVVISPPYKSAQGGNAVVSLGQIEGGGGNEGIMTEMIRDALLYWDRIDYPYNPYIEMHTVTPECRMLVDEGILTRVQPGTRASRPSNPTLFEETVVLPVIDGFLELEARQPGCWAMLEPWETTDLTVGAFSLGRGVQIDLVNALIVPDRGVPIEKVLRFKQDRAAELASLWGELDTIYNRIVNSGDPALNMASELARLDRAIYNIRAVGKEAFPIRIFKSLKCSLGSVLGTATNTGAVGEAFGLPAAQGMVAGAAVGLIPALKILKGTPSINGVPVTSTPFAYLYEVGKGLG